MNARRCVRSAARWLAAGAGLAATSYAGYVAVSWYRYGSVPPRARDEDADALLETFMPSYEVRERHHVRVSASPEITMAAAADMDLQQSAIIRTVFRARELIMRGQRMPDHQPHAFVAQMRAIGWGVLADVPGREILMGAVTQPWKADVVFRSLPPADFAAFREPGYVKIAWTLRADPAGAGESVFRTETRAAATDPSARARFRRYWSLVSPGVALIRLMSLSLVRADAERRAPESIRRRACYVSPCS